MWKTNIDISLFKYHTSEGGHGSQGHQKGFPHKLLFPFKKHQGASSLCWASHPLACSSLRARQLLPVPLSKYRCSGLFLSPCASLIPSQRPGTKRMPHLSSLFKAVQYIHTIHAHLCLCLQKSTALPYQI